MKRIVIKNKTHKVLQEQSQKLKNKLQLLKQQIQLKKKEKESSKNIKLAQSNVNKHNVNQENAKQNQAKFSKFLADLKMENIQSKLFQKQIKSIKDFMNIKIQELDKWKDIAVGYRIKIKKYLSNNRIGQNKQFIQQQHSYSNKNSIEMSNGKQKQKDIEQIIINRNKNTNFVPLHAHFKQNQQQQQLDQQLDQQQQEKMINNLMNAFQIIDLTDQPENQPQPKLQSKGQQSSRVTKIINNASRVIEQPKSIWKEIKVYPDYKYCWSCLNFINQSNHQIHNNRQFCSQRCIDTYKTSLNRQNDEIFYKNVEKTQKKFQQFLKNRGKNQNGSQTNVIVEKQEQDEQDEVEDIELLDLQIL